MMPEPGGCWGAAGWGFGLSPDLRLALEMRMPSMKPSSRMVVLHLGQADPTASLSKLSQLSLGQTLSFVQLFASADMLNLV
jgi:hypothetical protein